jgi:ADP-heptose:LPS heptosyltransferase
MVGSWSAPVIRDDPNLDAVLEFDQDIFLRKRWGGLFRLLLGVRRGRFDCAVILHALPPIHLFMRLAGIPRRYGMARKGRGAFLTASVPEAFDPERYYGEKYQEVAALAGAVPGPQDPGLCANPREEAKARLAMADAGLRDGEEFLLVAPGGGRNPVTDAASKRWPKENFVEVVLDLMRERPALRVVIAGAESDRQETGFLARELPGAIDLTAKLTLPELAGAARMARAILCNDSSLLHIGIACGTPVVAPFGPTSARQLVPARALAWVRQSDAPSSPCYQVGSGIPFPESEIGFQCMQAIRPAHMLPLLERALDLK